MNVLVYSGPDATPTLLEHTFASLRTILAPDYAIQPVDQKVLSSQPWTTSCALLVLPSFHPSTTSPFSPAAHAEIQKYVTGGGMLLALGTGVRAAIRKERGPAGVSALSTQLSTTATRAHEASLASGKLMLQDCEGKGLTISLASNLQSEQEGEVDATSIRLADESQLERILQSGVVDIPQTESSSDQDLKPLAHYTSSEPPGPTAIRASIGRGAASFSSAHIETPITNDTAQEMMRLQALRATIESLGLRLAQEGEGLEVVLRPTPQILSGVPWRPGMIDTIVRALQVPDLASAAPYKLKDRHDTFLFHPQEAAAGVFSDQREAVKTWSHDPETWNPKHIVVYGDDAIPPKNLTPKFDIARYYKELNAVRGSRGCRETYKDGAWGIGEVMLYGERVTSTQTMLDRNTRLLETFPTPILSLASTQLTGRGRGANVWLSPPGCLMFSLLLRVPLAVLPAQKLIFIQYLFALAVVEACRADGVLGDEAGSRVRIKWPNDIYGITQDGERKKLGGILVNTSFGAGKVEVVIGCGLNVLNDPPILSLAQLLPGGRALPTMERTLAAIMTRFERMWDDFLYARGSFEPFMDLYLERWLNSDQEMTLTTVTPPRKVRIVGITPDHGLLRTLPELERDGSMGYIDLQPDGNSFDLLVGLIKTKDHITAPSPSCWIVNDSLSIWNSIALHPVLPMDVFEEVIHHASNNTMSLRNLSLTCSTFRHRVCYHLFTSIVIKTPQQLESSSEFLDSHLWLTPVIRRVALRIAIPSALNPSHVLDIVPVHLLSRLPNLCSWSMGPNSSLPIRLSLHRRTISCYRRYSIGIQNLEISSIVLVGNILDFKRLVSAFTTLQSLTCSNIDLKISKQRDTALYASEINMRHTVKNTQIRHLYIGLDVHIQVVEFLLISTTSTLKTLTLTFKGDDSLAEPQAMNDNYIHVLDELISHLSQLSSLTLVIKGRWGMREDMGMSQAIRYITQILEKEQARQRDVGVYVEFELDAIASFACWCFNSDGFLLEACRGLEEVLLAFSLKAPNHTGVLFHRPTGFCRTGRAHFWSPAIKRTFPKLEKMGLLTLMPTDTGPSDPPGHEEMLMSLVASSDSKWMATASRDGTVIVWDIRRGTIMQEWVAHQGHIGVYALTFSPSSLRLLSSGDGPTEKLAVWEIGNSVRKAAQLEGHTQAVTTCAWSPDGTLIASASNDGTVRVWDAHTFQQRSLLEDPPVVSRPQNLQFSPDSSYLAWRRESLQSCIQVIWRPSGEEKPRILPDALHLTGQYFQVNAFSFDPDSKRIATAHGSWRQELKDYVVQIWDVATGATLAILTGHSSSVTNVSFSLDGRFLLSASLDGSAKLWDTNVWEEIASLAMEEGGRDSAREILVASFSPDGMYIVTGSSEKTVQLWRTGDASCAASFTEHTADIWHVAFSPDSQFLASGDKAGIVHIRYLSDLL